MQTAVDCGSNSELDPFGHVQPMKFMMQGICQTLLKFARVSDNAGSCVHHSLEFVNYKSQQ